MGKGKKNKGGLTIIIMGGSPKVKGKMKKPEMAYGGSVGGKKHMYAGGGSVTDNAGLRALKMASPSAYANIKNG